MRLGLHQSARMEQRLLQSPQMIQAMQILQLGSQELIERMQQELVENPFLELAEGGPVETGVAEQDESGVERAAPDDAALASMAAEIERYRYELDGGRRKPTAAGQEQSDRKQEALANTPDSGKTLSEELGEELAFLELDERGRRIAEQILASLDDRGYLTVTHEELAAAASVPDEDPVSLAEVQGALTDLRHVSHPAMGARDLRECLLLQIADLELPDPLPKTILEQHIEELVANGLPRIAKATGRSIEDVNEAVEALRKLDPIPGAGYGETQSAPILPDVVVEEIDGEYHVRLNRERTPRITLSPAYKEFLKAAPKEGGAKEWIKKRMESARWFLDAVEQRSNTLERVAKEIFTRQQGFLEKGVPGLVPLRMQDVADTVGVHISTVSRAVAGKYAQTPRGVLALKYFFSGGTSSESGEVSTQASLKQRIAQIVSAEDPKHPFSDEELAAKLEEQDRIKLARRTVTKYRKALGIPASSQRKKF